MLGAGVTAALRVEAPALVPPTVVTQTLRPTPNVLRAVRDLSRLEGASFHIERVIDLRNHESRLFGLIEGDDTILLVASGDVVAGVELGALSPGAVEVDPVRRRVRLRLPRATVFSASLNSEQTYVYQRHTDLTARRHEALESEARAEAERAMRRSALAQGILPRAEQSAARTLQALLGSLGFQEVSLEWEPR